MRSQGPPMIAFVVPNAVLADKWPSSSLCPSVKCLLRIILHLISPRPVIHVTMQIPCWPLLTGKDSHVHKEAIMFFVTRLSQDLLPCIFRSVKHESAGSGRR
ncbi:hypothetical protein VFPPC_18711 [Pochonia chlamydosporia 170]|uniref:Uncharacterized protein n=1 Tax=Pochonia chlamydosporia 170 TaxID=1380566 RepID=A0A219ASF3_METCM|nr:hypothetical protein VFPPC_18711 [Pochonia chlamydosporia 170]OWT43562.1 hypothetical protein VFPPC_18711 [Pochonia chlamydosporia 170]